MNLATNELKTEKAADSRRRLLTMEEVAKRLGVSPRTVFTWLREGRLAKVQLGRRVGIHEVEVERIEREGIGEPLAAVRSAVEAGNL